MNSKKGIGTKEVLIGFVVLLGLLIVLLVLTGKWGSFMNTLQEKIEMMFRFGGSGE